LEQNDLREGENLLYAIQKAVETKAGVVEEDEKEQDFGLRSTTAIRSVMLLRTKQSTKPICTVRVWLSEW
jgi:hypothetical protein